MHVLRRADFANFGLRNRFSRRLIAVAYLSPSRYWSKVSVTLLSVPVNVVAV